MPAGRLKLKQVSIALTLLMMQILSEQGVMAENHAEPSFNLNPHPSNVNLFSLSINDPDGFKAALQQPYARAFIPEEPFEANRLISSICQRRTFIQLWYLLRAAELPSNEALIFETMINLLARHDTSPLKDSSAFINNLYYYIHHFNPSVVIALQVKEATIREFFNLVPGVKQKLEALHNSLSDNVKAGEFELKFTKKGDPTSPSTEDRDSVVFALKNLRTYTLIIIVASLAIYIKKLLNELRTPHQDFIPPVATPKPVKAQSNKKKKKKRDKPRVKPDYPTRAVTQPKLSDETSKSETPAVLSPMPTEAKPALLPIQVSLKVKIENLIRNPTFPPQTYVKWVKLPDTTLEEVTGLTQDHANDPLIKAQQKSLVTINQTILTSKEKLDDLQATYIKLIAAYDAMHNPDDAALKEFEDKIIALQLSARSIIDEITHQMDAYHKMLGTIKSRIIELKQKAAPAAETEAERKARIARLKAAKQAAKDAKAEQAMQAARIEEAEAKRDALRAAENEERLKDALLKRLMEPSDHIKTHFRCAHNALLILNDIANAEEQYAAYLRDACILSCTQLYEALANLSDNGFDPILPNKYLLTIYRNVFAHDATYAECDNSDWKRIAGEAYQAYFEVIDAFQQVRSPGMIYKAKAFPELRVQMPKSTDFPFDEKKLVFHTLCQRYIAFSKTLNTIYATHEKQETPLQRDEINLVVVAMRGLILQMVDVGNGIGFTSKNEDMSKLAGYRNQEAHNGDITNVHTLINLSTSVEALASRIKLPEQQARPSQVGMYAPRVNGAVECVGAPKLGQ